ncbi:MAG TPA: NUDIX hydrolase [Gemmatimonadaceae bacterium]|nr:NUDIX hydrolase [Gemmatimonadaceae bacterium]
MSGRDDPTAGAAEPSAAPTGKIASERVYSGRIINLDRDTVRFPDGSIGELEMIRHPGASAVVPFVSEASGDDPQILMVRQYRYAAEDFLYEIPAGRLDPGEAPLACAKRELREETGCTARSMEFLFTMFTTPGFTDERIHVFMATGLERGETAHESDEFITVETVTLSNALRFIQEGRIKDGKTALAILFAAGFRAGR